MLSRPLRHMATKCPIKGQEAFSAKWQGPSLEGLAGRAPLAMVQSQPPYPTMSKHLVILSLLDRRAVEVWVMVDSGVTANFMDAEFVVGYSH